MASIDKRPTGEWRARWREYPGGPQKSQHFRRKIDAQQFLDGLRGDQARGQYVAPELGRITVGDLGATLLETKTDPNTKVWNRSMLRHVNEPIVIAGEPRFSGWQRVQIGSVDHVEIQKWVSLLDESGLGADTVRGAYRVLHEVVTLALRGRRIGYDPCLGVKLPKVNRREMLFLSPAQINLLGDELERRAPGNGWGLLVRFTAYSGCRAGEVGGLRVENLDLLRHRCQIVGARKSYGEDGATKTSKPRWIDLPRQLCDELATHLGRARTPRRDDRVWTGERGGPLNHNWFYGERFRPVVEDLTAKSLLPVGAMSTGKPALLRFHDLRHTTVALLIAKGAQQYEVMEHLGHTNIQTTINTYGHLFPNVRERIRVALEDTWDEGRVTA